MSLLWFTSQPHFIQTIFEYTCVHGRSGISLAALIMMFSSSAPTSDPDFLHKSILPTDHFQASLPHLPIPKLEETCTRYLKAQRPLLTDEEYSKTEKIVDQFKNNEGRSMSLSLIISLINVPYSRYYLFISTEKKSHQNVFVQCSICTNIIS